MTFFLKILNNLYAQTLLTYFHIALSYISELICILCLAIYAYTFIHTFNYIEIVILRYQILVAYKTIKP